VGAATLSKKGV